MKYTQTPPLRVALWNTPNVNVYSQIYTFPRNFCFFEKAVDFTIDFDYNKNVGSPFFVTFAFQNQFAGAFPW